MKQAVVLAAFACTVIAQLAVPAWIIIGRERVLHNGVVYKFRTQPVDPEDLFRGRFVSLGYEQSFAPNDATQVYSFNEPVYARVENGDDGFARIAGISRTKPASGDYFLAHVGYVNPDLDQIPLTFPFDRFYMDESKAPKAEDAYVQHNRRGSSDAYVAVRVWNGDSAIENLYVGGLPIDRYLEQETSESSPLPASP